MTATDAPEAVPVVVSRTLYDRMCDTVGAVIEGPAGDEVVWFNSRAYKAVTS